MKDLDIEIDLEKVYQSQNQKKKNFKVIFCNDHRPYRIKRDIENKKTSLQEELKDICSWMDRQFVIQERNEKYSLDKVKQQKIIQQKPVKCKLIKKPPSRKTSKQGRKVKWNEQTKKILTDKIKPLIKKMKRLRIPISKTVVAGETSYKLGTFRNSSELMSQP